MEGKEDAIKKQVSGWVIHSVNHTHESLKRIYFLTFATMQQIIKILTIETSKTNQS